MSSPASVERSAPPALRRILAIACSLLLLWGETALFSQTPPSQAPQQPAVEQEAPKIPPDQLDALVAPIALYPDPLLGQALVAATYPLEIIQLQQWLEKNKDLKDKALTDAAMKQPWDASIQAMVVLPDVVKRLSEDIQWTTDLGNAFLTQQSEVMDAVQRMRKKAQDKGALKSGEQQKVETKTVENKTVIVVEPTSTEVIYVPSYNPVVVYGPPIYPYPPVYYPPPPPPGYYMGAAMITFGVGMAIGAAWGGHYGYGCGWGHNDININVNNNFHRNTNINPNSGGGNNWQHNPQHRGGAPYSNKATANKYGGSARGDSMASRQAGARQQAGRQGGAGVSNRSAGGSNSIGGRNVSQGSGKGKSAFGGGSGGYSGRSARTSSARGSSSMGRSRGGGGGGGRRR